MLDIVEIISEAGPKGCLLSDISEALNSRQKLLKVDSSAEQDRNNQPGNDRKRKRKSDDSDRENEDDAEEDKSKPVQSFNSSNIHPYADRVIANMAAVKRILLHGGNSNSSKPPRATTNYSAIIHLKRFAAAYQPEDDGMEFLADEGLKESVFRFILRVLDTQEMRAMPLNDLGEPPRIHSSPLFIPLLLSHPQRSSSECTTASLRVFESISCITRWRNRSTRKKGATWIPSVFCASTKLIALP